MFHYREQSVTFHTIALTTPHLLVTTCKSRTGVELLTSAKSCVYEHSALALRLARESRFYLDACWQITLQTDALLPQIGTGTKQYISHVQRKIFFEPEKALVDLSLVLFRELYVEKALSVLTRVSTRTTIMFF